MRFFATLLFVVLFTGCDSTSESDNPPVSREVQSLSLNGDWKFNVIDGQGYNYINVVSAPTDIIVDNSDTDKVIVKGNWESSTDTQRNTSNYGKDYLRRTFAPDQSEDNYVRFFPRVEKSGYYEAFVIFPFAFHRNAQYTINHAGGQTKKYYSQRNQCSEWLSVGIYAFGDAEQDYIEVSGLPAGAMAADAVMLKPVTAEKFERAKALSTTMFQPELDDSDWHTLKVPGHWAMLNEYSNYSGLGWYRKTFSLPDDWQDRANERVRIRFDGVYHVSKVYLNGEFIGRHQGGFTSFEYDITEQVKYGEENIIAVEVDNNFIVSATWNWGGIIRDVTILKSLDARIEHQYLHAEPDLQTGTADIDLRVRVENNASHARNITIHSRISKDGILASLQKIILVPANQITTAHLTTQLRAQDVSLWHFDNPELYHFETTITEDTLSAKNTTLDTRTDTFGIRKVEVTDSALLLNGKPVRTGGFNRVSEDRFWGATEPMSVLEKDVDLMKEAGANFMRIMHGAQNKKLFELADRKGLMLFEEANIRNLANEEFTTPDYPLAKHWIKGMIERDINHPSIIGWSVGNELEEHYDYATMALRYVKEELDPYRLVTSVSHTGWKATSTRENDPNTHVDILMHNMYPYQGEPQKIIDDLREKWPEKAVFISEYGLTPMPDTSLDQDIPTVSSWNDNFRHKNDFVIGTSLWTFNDYRSGYAGTTAEENRVWGVVNVWRQKRHLFDRVRKDNSPIQRLAISDIDFTDNTANVLVHINASSDYPAYDLNGYSLDFTFRDANGRTLYSGSAPLPAMSPGDEAWQSDISWKKLDDTPLDLTVQVSNPLGYVREDSIVAFNPPPAPVITHIESAKSALRIHFDGVYGADTYQAQYSDKNGQIITSQPTITNTITLDGLAAGSYNIEVIATNSKGKSQPSLSRSASTGERELAPVIWDAFIADNKLVVGYSSEHDDQEYIVDYGAQPDSLDQTFVSNTRGMLIIETGAADNLYFKIKRRTNEDVSAWSPTKNAIVRQGR